MVSCEVQTGQNLRRTRPTRVINELYRRRTYTKVAQFYADELSELGFDTCRINNDNFKQQTPEEKKQTYLDLEGSLKKLAKSGKVVPEAIYLSSRMWQTQGRSEDTVNYLARLDRPHFGLLLRTYFSNYLQQGQQASSVLSLGCGTDLEAQLIRYQLAKGVDRSLHIGIDSDASKIQVASKLNPSAQKYLYIKGDADSSEVEEILSSMVGFEYQFDFIVARHFPIWKREDLWRSTLDKYAARLKTGGILLMTLYYDPEFEEVQSKGMPSNYRVLISERNKARSFNRRLNFMTLIEGFVIGMGGDNSSPNSDPYQLWLNNMCRDKYIVVAQKS